MKLKSNFKRILSGVMSLAMAATLVPSIPVLAEDFTTQNYVYDNYAVSYNVTNSWGDTEVVSVTLSNTGDSTIENWMLYFDPNGSTSSIWDAQWAETSTGVSYVKNAGYNARIEPNSSLCFLIWFPHCLIALPDKKYAILFLADPSFQYSVYYLFFSSLLRQSTFLDVICSFR